MILKRFKISVIVLVLAPCIQPPAWAQGNASLAEKHEQFLAATGQTMSALAHAQARGANQGPHIALLYAALDHPEKAETALQGWQKNAEADTAWLALAQAQYTAGQTQAASRSLAKTTNFLPQFLAEKKSSLLARSLLDQQRNDEAADVLLAQRQQWALSDIDAYNLGVAWLRAGDAARGVGELQALGSYQGDDPASQALADQANLVLGYWFLRQQRGGLARAAFARIRLHGPLANNGKIGIGWAELAKGGGLQRVSKNCGAPQSILWEQSMQYRIEPEQRCDDRTGSFQDDVMAGAPKRENIKHALRRAAVAWQSVAESNAFSPIVQEALVALPFALYKSDSTSAAITAYEQAIERLEIIQNRLEERLGELLTTPTTQVAATQSADFHHAADWSLRRGMWERMSDMQRETHHLQRQLRRNDQRFIKFRKPISPAILQILASILNDLRNSTDNQSYSQPNSVQRGFLIFFLQLQETLPAQANSQLTHTHSKCKALEARLENLQARLAAVRKKRKITITKISLEFTQARLRDAYTNLADIGAQ